MIRNFIEQKTNQRLSLDRIALDLNRNKATISSSEVIRVLLVLKPKPTMRCKSITKPNSIKIVANRKLLLNHHNWLTVHDLLDRGWSLQQIIERLK